MNTVEGFFVESGLFLKCPHCKNRTRQNVQSFFLSVHMDKPVTCTKCEKEFTIHVELRPVGDAVEHRLHTDGAVCPAHQTYFEEDGTCAIAGCEETRPAGKA